MVTEDRIRYWSTLYNNEIGRTDRIEASVQYFLRLKDAAIFIDTDQYYVVLFVSEDMWGDKFLSVCSLYIKPEYRTGKYFLQIQKNILRTAQQHAVKYIVQGSHIDDKYFKFLSGIGYKTCEMRKDL